MLQQFSTDGVTYLTNPHYIHHIQSHTEEVAVWIRSEIERGDAETAPCYATDTRSHDVTSQPEGVETRCIVWGPQTASTLPGFGLLSPEHRESIKAAASVVGLTSATPTRTRRSARWSGPKADGRGWISFNPFVAVGCHARSESEVRCEVDHTRIFRCLVYIERAMRSTDASM